MRTRKQTLKEVPGDLELREQAGLVNRTDQADDFEHGAMSIVSRVFWGPNF